MDLQDKTKEELIKELQELRHENISLKASYDRDIARSKQNEIKLQISEAQKNAILNGISANIAFVDKDLKIVWANKTAANSVNKTPDVMIGQTCHHFWGDPAKPCENCPSLKALETKKTEHILQYTTDGRIWDELGEPVFDEMGNLIGIVEIAFDITERKLAEEASVQSEKKFRTLFENMIDGSAMHTLVYNNQGLPEDYRIIEVNPAFETLLGISRETVINKTSREAYGVDEPPYLEIYSKVALTGEHEVFETYFAPLDKFFSISVYSPYKGSFATIFENITERKKAEQDLHIILSKYKVLFEILPIGITITDAAGNIVESNKIAEKLLGISIEEQEKRKIDGQEWQIIRPDGLPMSASEFPSVQALEQGRMISDVEMGIVKGRNQTTWINVSATPIPLEGYGVAIIYGDITERKQAEYENERTQKLLEDSQRIGKIGGWEVNMDTMELKWTKEMYHIHELDSTFKPVVDKRVNFYTSESLPAIDEAVQKAIREGGSFEVDSEIITAKGNRRLVKSIGKADIANRRVFGLFQDITERKRAEEELKRSEYELRLAQQITHIGSFSIDLTTNQVIWTEELYKMYGFDPSLPPPLLNESQTLFTPESWELLSTSIANTIQTGIPYEIELTTIRKDGSNGWMWARGEATINTEGKITNIWGAVQDITDRKRTEIALHETNAYLENLINYANAPIIVWDPQFRITLFNHAFEFITGYTEADVLGKSLEILFPPELIENSMGLIRKTSTGERWKTVEIQIQHRDKSVRTLLWNSATLFTPDGKNPVATIAQGQDITDRKLAEEALKNSAAQLKELNATKDKFFSIIAHDLKSPFSGILGFSEILKDEAPDLDKNSIADYAHLIHKSAKHTFELLENLLDWARMQQEKIPFEPKKFLISSMVDSEFEGLKNNANQKNIALINNIHENIILFADENMIGTVLRNLISNAIKFTPKNGKVQISAEIQAGQLEVSVSDTGMGMASDTIEKLFNLETSFTTRGTENEKGTGLGLLLCKEFIVKHSGKIGVNSERGKGSKFYFKIPLMN